MTRLPPAWARLRLSELLRDLRNGTTAPQNKERIGIPVTRIESLQAGKFDVQRFGFVDARAEELANFLYENGDIAFSHINSLVHVGKTAIYEGTPPVLVHGMNLLRLRPDLRLITPRFLNWALNESGFRNRVRTNVNKAVNQVSINQQRLGVLEVALAPLNEQRRIVEKLDAIFEQTHAAKARLERLPAMLDRLRRSILAAAFRGDLTADWRAAHPNVESAAALLDRIRAEHRQRWEDSVRAKGKVPSRTAYRAPAEVEGEELTQLPSGWAWASVDQVAELQLGQQRAPIHANAQETHPYVRAANIKWDGLDLSDVKRMGFPDLERYRLRYGDVLLSEASGSASEVGKPAIWRDEIPGCCYQKTLLRARPRSSDVTSEWLHAAFLADALLGRFARMAPGVGILHLTADRMLGWPVPVAPAPEQHVLVERVRHALDAVSKLENAVAHACQNVERVEQATLGRAFRGELVEQDPADEPVSALLDRLRGIASTEGPPSPKAERKAGARSRREEESRT